MEIALFVFAFSAGVAIFFSPCSVALLPSYISFLLVKEEDAALGKMRLALAGLKIGLVVSLGIVTIFLGLGLLVALLGNVLAPFAVWFGTTIGILLVIMGIFMLLGKHIPGFSRLHINNNHKASLKTFYIFGLGYAIGGIACSLGIFLFVVGTALASGSFQSALSSFIAFALGTVVLMILVTTASAVAKSFMHNLLIKYIKPVQIFSAIIIIGGGLYLIWFNLQAFIF